jgi:hypothetical protein
MRGTTRCDAGFQAAIAGCALAALLTPVAAAQAPQVAPNIPRRMGARLVMGAADYNLLDRSNPAWKPKRDIVTTDGMRAAASVRRRERRAAAVPAGRRAVRARGTGDRALVGAMLLATPSLDKVEPQSAIESRFSHVDVGGVV